MIICEAGERLLLSLQTHSQVKASPDKAQGEAPTLEKRQDAPSSTIPETIGKPGPRADTALCDSEFLLLPLNCWNNTCLFFYQSKCRLNFIMHHRCFESTIKFSKSSVSNISGLFPCGKSCCFSGLDTACALSSVCNAFLLFHLNKAQS